MRERVVDSDTECGRIEGNEFNQYLDKDGKEENCSMIRSK